MHTFRERSVRIQGTFNAQIQGVFSVHIQGTFNAYSKKQRTFREHLGHSKRTFNAHIQGTFSVHIQGIFSAHSGNARCTFRERSEHIQGTVSERSVGNVQCAFYQGTTVLCTFSRERSVRIQETFSARI